MLYAYMYLTPKQEGKALTHSTKKAIKQTYRLYIHFWDITANWTNQPTQNHNLRQKNIKCVRKQSKICCLFLLFRQTKNRGNRAKSRAKNGVQQLDRVVRGARIGRRMAMHSVHAREAEQQSAIGSNLLLPFAATGSPRSLPLDLPLSPSSWFFLLLCLLHFLLFFRWWWRRWWLFLHPQLQQRILLSFPFRLIISLSLGFMYSNFLNLSLSFHLLISFYVFVMWVLC